ncbi:MAG: hypothetical protein VR65_14920 [Desulfobulbaceae bacterium BRH_c16a]|nr:MAG: hypothetical protein VR65_14920 [Desulfobulbaceae bacterium BRH_c16a]
MLVRGDKEVCFSPCRTGYWQESVNPENNLHLDYIKKCDRLCKFLHGSDGINNKSPFEKVLKGA